MDQPLVSCLMVTMADESRLPFIQKSLEDFREQTYANKELIVVLDSPKPKSEAELRKHIESLGANNIRVVTPAQKKTLGALRNLSIGEARGRFFCQWDDDDRYHRSRIEKQWRHLQNAGADASYLQNILHSFSGENVIFWCNWNRTKLKGHPGTLFMEKSEAFQYKEKDEFSEISEDRYFQELLAKKNKKIAFADESPALYIYQFHGFNTWHLEHHQFLAAATAETKEFVLERKLELAADLQEMNLNPQNFQFSDGENLFKIG